MAEIKLTEAQNEAFESTLNKTWVVDGETLYWFNRQSHSETMFKAIKAAGLWGVSRGAVSGRWVRLTDAGREYAIAHGWIAAPAAPTTDPAIAETAKASLTDAERAILEHLRDHDDVTVSRLRKVTAVEHLEAVLNRLDRVDLVHSYWSGTSTRYSITADGRQVIESLTPSQPATPHTLSKAVKPIASEQVTLSAAQDKAFEGTINAGTRLIDKTQYGFDTSLHRTATYDAIVKKGLWVSVENATLAYPLIWVRLTSAGIAYAQSRGWLPDFTTRNEGKRIAFMGDDGEMRTATVSSEGTETVSVAGRVFILLGDDDKDAAGAVAGEPSADAHKFVVGQTAYAIIDEWITEVKVTEYATGEYQVTWVEDGVVNSTWVEMDFVYATRAQALQKPTATPRPTNADSGENGREAEHENRMAMGRALAEWSEAEARSEVVCMDDIPAQMKALQTELAFYRTFTGYMVDGHAADEPALTCTQCENYYLEGTGGTDKLCGDCVGELQTELAAARAQITSMRGALEALRADISRTLKDARSSRKWASQQYEKEQTWGKDAKEADLERYATLEREYQLQVGTLESFEKQTQQALSAIDDHSKAGG